MKQVADGRVQQQRRQEVLDAIAEQRRRSECLARGIRFVPRQRPVELSTIPHDTAAEIRTALAQQFVDKVEAYERQYKCGRREAIDAIQLSHPELARAYREDIP
jgi:hypothetical protein